MKKKNLMVGIPLFIIGIAAAVAIGINASDLIISLGIVVFKIFSFVAYAALGVGFLLIAVPIVIRLLKNRAEKEALAKKAAEEEEAVRKKKEDVKGLVRELMSEEEKFVPIG